MQSAYDRDEYIKIQWEHIRKGTEHNFRKYNSSVVSHFNSTYDYGSVMHYSGKAFSTDGVATIVPLVSVFLYYCGRLCFFFVSLLIYYHFRIFIIYSFIERIIRGSDWTTKKTQFIRHF